MSLPIAIWKSALRLVQIETSPITPTADIQADIDLRRLAAITGLMHRHQATGRNSTSECFENDHSFRWSLISTSVD